MVCGLLRGTAMAGGTEIERPAYWGPEISEIIPARLSATPHCAQNHGERYSCNARFELSPIDGAVSRVIPLFN